MVHIAATVTTESFILFWLTFPHLVNHRLQKVPGKKGAILNSPLRYIRLRAGEIGQAKNVQHRMERLQLGCPQLWEPLLCSAVAKKREIHRLVGKKDSRSHRTWDL